MVGLVALVVVGGVAAFGHGGLSAVFAAQASSHDPALEVGLGAQTGAGSQAHPSANGTGQATQTQSAQGATAQGGSSSSGAQRMHDSGLGNAQADAPGADDVNQNCTLIVPAHPLSATGLATPYHLEATQRGDGPCHEANPEQAAFVQAAVLNTDTGQIAIYNPLVVDSGTSPARAPVVPPLPTHSVVAIWFGFNGQVLQLRGVGSALADGACVGGLARSPFGQVAYCNAPAFFAQANAAIGTGMLTVPALGTARDGLACPTVRDFSVVDMDQSDNVTTTYLLTREGRLAQNTSVNSRALPGAVALSNGSDNGLLSHAIDGALGCTAWMAPDLADPGHTLTALPLDELQAAAGQGAPVALVPSGDPMTLVNGQPSLAKQDLYRAGVDQRVETSQMAARQDQRAYCQNLLAVAPKRLTLDARYTRQAASPMPTVANNLFTFLAQRLRTTLGAQGLNCTGLLGVRNPVSIRADGKGVVIAATISTRVISTATATDATHTPNTTSSAHPTTAPTTATPTDTPSATDATPTPTDTPSSPTPPDTSNGSSGGTAAWTSDQTQAATPTSTVAP